MCDIIKENNEIIRLCRKVQNTKLNQIDGISSNVVYDDEKQNQLKLSKSIDINISK